MIIHPLEPVFDKSSRVLILGTMPSPASRERGFYYAHPQNRFWRVMFGLFEQPFSAGTEQRRRLCLERRIALWDVLQSCSIEGASDSSIKNAAANDLSRVMAAADIKAVFTTGQTAGKLYRRLCQRQTGMPAIVLPSPSGANCAVKIEALLESYREILRYL